MLKGYINQNPDSWNECFYMGWETADEYLSGCIMDKLKKLKRQMYSTTVTFQKVVPVSLSKTTTRITGGKLLLFGEI